MKILITIALLFTFVYNSSATPLVVRLTKSLRSRNLVEMGIFSSNKYKQIRIGTSFTPTGERTDVTPTFTFTLVADNQEIPLKEVVGNDTFIVDIPSDIIKIRIKGGGDFKVYIWGIEEK